MEKPKLEDFGLTADQYENKGKRLSKLAVRAATFSMIATGIVGTVLSWRSRLMPRIVAILLGIITSAGAGLFIGMIVYGSIYFLGDRFIRSLRAVRDYESASREYNDWWVHRQEQFWASLDGRRFELEVAALYGRHGYVVSFTPASGDQGIDIEIKRAGDTAIVQCKAHSNPVGPDVVRNLYGTLVNSKAERAILVCTAGFTEGVIEFAADKPIELVSVSDLISMQKWLERNSSI